MPADWSAVTVCHEASYCVWLYGWGRCLKRARPLKRNTQSVSLDGFCVLSCCLNADIYILVCVWAYIYVCDGK